MEFAIIAAGEGSRLRQEGFKFSKPMVVLQELTIIERLIQIFARNGAVKIHVIINEFSPELSIHLNSVDTNVPLNVVTKTTESSLHSFYTLLPFINSNKVCVTTVDTIFNEVEFEAYINANKADNSIDGLMAVTSFVDDESPLYLSTDNHLRITGFYDSQPAGVFFVSGGIYCLTANVFPFVKKAIETGQSRMRNFQRMMINEGLYLRAYPFSKIIDIDHLSDIAKAENFLRDSTLAAESEGI